MYEVRPEELLVVHDSHPEYVSTAHALSVSTHRASAWLSSIIARMSLPCLAERGEWEKRVVGVSFDGTGYGDDGSIWGGEIFVGSVKEGFERVAHLRSASLPGGDAAAQYPVQAAAGFLGADHGSIVARSGCRAPFYFPERYQNALELIRQECANFCDHFCRASLRRSGRASRIHARDHIRRAGRDVAGTTGPQRRLRQNHTRFPFVGDELDFRPLLQSIIRDRLRGRDVREIARAFQRGVARGTGTLCLDLQDSESRQSSFSSGGVFQNELLLEDLKDLLIARPLDRFGRTTPSRQTMAASAWDRPPSQPLVSD